MMKPENVMPFMVPGRLIHVKTDKDDWGWGILVSFSKQRINTKNKDLFKKAAKFMKIDDIQQKNESTFVLDVYLYSKDRLTSDVFLQPGNPLKQDGRLGIIPVVMHTSTIKAISTIQLNLPHNHRDADNFKTVELMYMELLKRFDQGKTLKTLHPIKDMEIEYDADEDKMDINKLIEAQEKIKEELLQDEL